MRRRFRLPERSIWRGEMLEDNKRRVERVVLVALQRAVSSVGGETVSRADADRTSRRPRGEAFDPGRYNPATGTYDLPSYDADGRPKPVALLSGDDVIEGAPPFDDALVMQLPGNRYVKVRSHRYTTSEDIGHAVTWGKLLFGTATWMIASRTQRSGSRIYYVAALDERLTEADLRVHPFDPKTPLIAGATGAFFGRVLPSLPDNYRVEAVYTPDGG